MFVFDFHILEHIIFYLNSSDLYALLQVCSTLYSKLNLDELKLKFSRQVFEFDHRNFYLGESSQLPNGTYHGKSIRYFSIPKRFGSQIILREQEYFDGILIGEKKWKFCGIPYLNSVRINNNYYLPCDEN